MAKSAKANSARESDDRMKKIASPYIPAAWHRMMLDAASKQGRSLNNWMRRAIYAQLRRDGFRPKMEKPQRGR